MSVDCSTGFLEAICANPQDTGVRLIYSDWLEEHGQVERAEFIRCQIELAKVDEEISQGFMSARDWEYELSRAIGDCQCRRCTLRHRELELLDWPNVRDVSCNGFLWSEPLHQSGFARDYWYAGWFRRGFVERVECTCADWLRHGPQVVRAQPVLEVKPTGRKPERNNYHVVDSVRAEYRGMPFWAWHLEEINTFAPDFLPLAIYMELPDSIAGAWKHYASEASAWQALSAACITWARGPHPALGLEALPVTIPS